MRPFTTLLALLCVYTVGVAAACGTQHAAKPRTKVLTVTGPNTTAKITYADTAILTIPRPTALTSTSNNWSIQASISSCAFSIIEQAGTTSACVDAAHLCHAYRYRRKNANLVLEELHATAAKRVCRDSGLAFKKPK